MGDMADDLIDMIFLDDWAVDQEDNEDVECKYCGKTGLFWQQIGDKWVLFQERRNGNFPHRCNRGLTKKAILSSFTDID